VATHPNGYHLVKEIVIFTPTFFKIYKYMTKEEFNNLNIYDEIIINDIIHRITSINKDQELIEMGVVQFNEFNRIANDLINRSWYRYENIELVREKTTEVPRNIHQYFG